MIMNKEYSKSLIVAWLFDNDRTELRLKKRNRFVTIGCVDGKRVYFLERRCPVFHNILKSTTFTSLTLLKKAI